jgi:aspartokinase-like uncharacterized kinase
MRIVKLGGSLADDPALTGWLMAVAEAPGGPRLVVPGGGPFADAIRDLQGRLGFDDLVAHRMAILAMQQYGLHLQGLEPRLRLVEDEIEIRALGSTAGLVLPWRMLGLDPTIGASWAVTSDSLALVLARRLAAGELILVKSAELPAGPIRATALAEAGLLDPAFPKLAAGYSGRIRLVHRDDIASRQALGASGEAAGGTLIEGVPLSVPAAARHHG